MKLLIVDDIAINRRLLQAQLAVEGHDSVEAANGVEALRLLETETVDGVISDILMPEMDGFRLCLELRKQDHLAALPFILYTSTYNSPSDRELAATVGADAYLTKPSPVVAIIDAVLAASAKDRSAQLPLRRKNDETMVLRQYNEALVRKLEEKNDELSRAVEHLNELNEQLERRVEQRTRELEMANRELEAFSYSVAHDLRSPLSAVHGFMRLLQHSMGPDPGAQEGHFLETINNNIQRMSLLIDDLLTLAQMGKQALVRKEVDLRALVEETLQGIREANPDRQVEVVIQPLPPAHGDVALLRQVFLNLIGNAFKYTGKVGHPRVEIGAQGREEGAVLYVRDNGAGFDMRYADRLFTAFQRLHSKREFEGTGVGLAIVDRIIQRHGGRIWATSVLGEGATFYFTLG